MSGYRFGDITKGVLRWAGVLEQPPNPNPPPPNPNPPPPNPNPNPPGPLPVAAVTFQHGASSLPIAHPPAPFPAGTNNNDDENDVISMLSNILTTSRVLCVSLPDVRRLALRETLRASSSNERAIAIMLENLQSSPFIPESQKDELANLVLEKNFLRLQQVLQCVDSPVATTNTLLFDEFRETVTLIFTRSKKMKQVVAERRSSIGAAIHQQTTIQGLRALALHSLESSHAFSADDGSRDQVASDILDCRYDLLLLPSRFDCEETQRRRGGGGGGGGGGEGVEEGEGEEEGGFPAVAAKEKVVMMMMMRRKYHPKERKNWLTTLIPTTMSVPCV